MKAAHLTARLSRGAAIAVTSAALIAGGSSLASADTTSPGEGSAPITTTTNQQTAGSHGLAPSKSANHARAAAATSYRHPVNITKLDIGGYVVSSKGPRTLRGGMRGKASNVSSVSMRARVYLGRKRVGTASVHANGAVYFRYHQKTDHRGRFKIGPTHVTGTRSNGTRFNYWDYTSGRFHIRAGLKGHFNIKRAGSRHVVHSRAKYWSTSKGKWKGYHHRAYVKVRKHGSWTNFRTIKLNKHGKDKFVFHSGTKRKYRLRLKTTTYVIGGKSTLGHKI